MFGFTCSPVWMTYSVVILPMMARRQRLELELVRMSECCLTPSIRKVHVKVRAAAEL